MSSKPKRRIVLFFDGTWNEDEDIATPTNIVRLREALKIGVDGALQARTATRHPSGHDPAKPSGSIVLEPDGTPVEYIVLYDRGVGTGAGLDRLKGGVFGDGLDRNVRQGYRFLSEHYRPGDEILVFGFSRGAFTARSLVGYLFATGLLKPEACDTQRENRAWAHYRTSPRDRYCAEWFALKPYMFDRETLRIRCLGVFDTVGALGIPLSRFRRANAERFAFHDTELSSIVDISLHAVAIDEHRRSFEAALWQKPKFKRFPGAHVEQIWFPGAHADIGGGYAPWSRDVVGRAGRQDITFDWMVKRVRALVPQIHLAAPDPVGPLALRIDMTAAKTGLIHRPWLVLDRIRGQACRSINQVEPQAHGRSKTVGLMPHAEPIYEAVHVSALELLNGPGVDQERGSGPVPYRPANLIAALPAIAATYRAASPTIWATWKPYVRTRPTGEIREPELCVVGWDGAWLEPNGVEGDRERCAVLALLPDPVALGLSRAPTPLPGSL